MHRHSPDSDGARSNSNSVTIDNSLPSSVLSSLHQAPAFKMETASPALQMYDPDELGHIELHLNNVCGIWCQFHPHLGSNDSIDASQADADGGVGLGSATIVTTPSDCEGIF